MQILNSIRERFAGRQLDAESRYEGLVSEAASGRDVDHDTLVELLTMTGRGMECFFEDAECLELRHAARLKLKEAERLRPACESACKATHEAAAGVDTAQVKAQKLIDAAMDILREKGDASGSLQRQIADLEREARQDLHATADPSFQQEIGRCEARIASLRMEQNQLGRSVGEDPADVKAAQQRYSVEGRRLQDRIEELRRQQLA